jgi:hypothetical protein
MPISVEIQDEKGHAEGEPWWHERSTELLVQPDSATTCLRFIDPYGDTTFNQYQLPVLIEEIEVLTRRAPDAEARTVLADLLAFLERARGRVHTYVKFIGD